MRGAFEALDQQQIDQFVAKHGTPLFVFDANYFSATCRNFLSSWQRLFPNGRVYLSYKTNPLPSLCEIAHLAELGADVVSDYELEHALLMTRGENICFNGPHKSIDALKLAISNGVTVNVDNFAEIDKLVNLNHRGPVGIRVNPGEPVHWSPDQDYQTRHALSQKQARFGFQLRDGIAKRAAVEMVRRGLDLNTIHVHLHSQITDWQLFLSALKPVAKFIAHLRSSGIEITTWNIGGGFGVGGMQRSVEGYFGNHGFDMQEFQENFLNLLQQNNLNDLCICCEPGRYLISDSMVLLTEVVSVNRDTKPFWLTLDGGTNIMPTAAYGERRRLRFFCRGNASRNYLEKL